MKFWPIHRHEFTEYVSRTCEGVTLNWGLRPEPCYSITWRCQCGKSMTEKGMLLPLLSFRADKDGWPLDDQGKRMKVAR